MTEQELAEIEATVKEYVCDCGDCTHSRALIAEVRKLRAQLYDAGLPDANDFPEVPNKWGGL